MIVRQTTPEERRRTDELFCIAFEFPMEEPSKEPESPRFHHWAAYTDEGDMMSTFTITDFQIGFDGHCCKMGGIGGVATLPQYRRMGGIRGCFESALPDLYDRGYDFSYLYPFSTAYYRKFGYECCVQKYHATVQLGLLNLPRVDGTLHLAESRKPMTEAIRAIDRVWEGQYNMMVQHSDEDYQWTNQFDPAASQEFTYVYFSPDRTPKAYTTFRMKVEQDGRNLICKRFFFVDKEGFLGLMQLFKSLASDHMYVKIPMPNKISMQYLLSEWSLGAAAWSVQPAGMVRVVNVRSVLEKARYIGSGRITLAITDPQIPKNNGSFTVTYADGRAVSVEKNNASPDAALTIQAFSALISGVSSFRDAAQWFSGLEINNPNAPLEQVFYRKDLMICDYF